MSQDTRTIIPDRNDALIALAMGGLTLAAYLHTLAPDILYGDSAEFQALAYTLGTTHSTGYPIYLLLARVVGFLPIGTLAWRINLFSAFCAAFTVSGVYLLARRTTHSRAGALLGSFALALSYTFWFQAIIAEVYTPALMFLVAGMLLLWRWQDSWPYRSGNLLLAGILAGAGLGVHAFVGLFIPAALVFILATLWARRADWQGWRRSLLSAAGGLAVGIVLFLGTFLLIDQRHHPSSFARAALQASRSIWSLAPEDLDSPFDRLYLTVSGRQWQDAMFAVESDEMGVEIGLFIGQMFSTEFSPWMMVLALIGLWVVYRATPSWGGFILTAFAVSAYMVLNYKPPDKYIFFLPVFLLAAILIGTGAGFLLEQFRRMLGLRSRWYWVAYPLGIFLLALLVIQPHWSERWQALQDGAATFVHDNYAYPVENLEEPRWKGEMLLAYLPDDAVAALEWRTLYTTYYLAHAERKSPGIILYEATPHPIGYRLSDSLIEELKKALQNGRPTFVDHRYENLEDHFRVLPAGGSGLYRLSPK